MNELADESPVRDPRVLPMPLSPTAMRSQFAMRSSAALPVVSQLYLRVLHIPHLATLHSAALNRSLPTPRRSPAVTPLSRTRP